MTCDPPSEAMESNEMSCQASRTENEETKALFGVAYLGRQVLSQRCH
jgi:hypothetical protein